MGQTHKTGVAEFFAQLKLWKEKRMKKKKIEKNRNERKKNEALSYLIELTPPVKITLRSI